MEKKGMRQADLMRGLGIKSSSMSNLINSRSKRPSATTLLRLCEILDTNQQYIMRGVGDPHARAMPVSDARIHADLDKLTEDKKQAIHAAILAFMASDTSSQD